MVVIGVYPQQPGKDAAAILGYIQANGCAYTSSLSGSWLGPLKTTMSVYSSALVALF